MHLFHRSAGRLFCEDVDLTQIVRAAGTPVYVYSAGTLVSNYRRLVAALAPLDATVCYAVKANGHLSLLKLLAGLGAGFDLVSAGEVRRALTAAPESLSRSVFAGVGKSETEIALGIAAGVQAFHVESEPELFRIDRVAAHLGKVAPVSLRVNPDVDAGTHAKITTGTAQNKFGIPLDVAAEVYRTAARLKNVEIRGVQMHIGSQITRVDPFVDAVGRVAEFIGRHREEFPLQYFSIGGGIGVAYRDALASGSAEWWESQPEELRLLTPEAYGRALVPLLQPLGMRILVEPGRFLVANAGVLLTRVEYVKRSAGKTFVIVDSAMNDLIRPAMYEAYHEIVPLQAVEGRPASRVDVVGPVCESGDCFASDRTLPAVQENEVLAILSAGAYGMSMASRYNTRPLAAEVLVQGGRWDLISDREDFENVIQRERMVG